MIATSLKLTGSAELDALLRDLPGRVQNKVMKQAINAGANPVLRIARNKVKRRSGILAKSLAKKVVSNAARETVTAIIGPRSDVVGMFEGKLQKPSRYAHLVENGFIDELGHHHPPQPFMNPALTEGESAAIAAMGEKMGEGIEREASRNA